MAGLHTHKDKSAISPQRVIRFTLCLGIFGIGGSNGAISGSIKSRSSLNSRPSLVSCRSLHFLEHSDMKLCTLVWYTTLREQYIRAFYTCPSFSLSFRIWTPRRTALQCGKELAGDWRS